MKVLLINNILYRRGGSEAVLFNTAKLLSDAGHEVRFFSLENCLNGETPQKSYFAPQPSGIRKAFSYFYNVSASRALDRVLEEWYPDIAHVHLFWGGLSPSIIRTLHRHSVPLVHTAHDYRMVCPAYTFRNGKGQVCEKCNKCFLPCVFGRCSKGSLLQSIVMAAEMRFRNTFFNPASKLDGIIYVSGFSKDIHEKHNPRLAEVRNTVLYNSSDRMDGAEAEEFYLYSGRLSPEKGCATMIEAFVNNPQKQLVVAGKGSQEGELKSISEGSGNISYKGYLQKDELFSLIKRCKFVIVPSEWYENNPMSIIEAYAASKPVIAARIGGIPEIVEDGRIGFLFEPGKVNDLREVLTKCDRLIESDYSRMCASASDKFSQSFSPGMYLERLVDFYNTVIKGC